MTLITVKDSNGNIIDAEYNTTGPWEEAFSYEINVGTVSAFSSTYIDVTLDFSIDVSFNDRGLFENKAEIISYNSSAKTKTKNYRQSDKDYVKVNENCAVSLEKFVSQVNGEDVKRIEGYGDDLIELERSGLRYNENLSGDDGILNKDPWKKTNPVDVISGDYVTFTIRLKNTGYNKIKVTKIYDTFTDNTSTGVKLIYDSSYGIQGNGGGTIENEHYNAGNYGEGSTVGRYLIKFNNPTTINPGSYIDVRIKFQLDASSGSGDIELFNKAAIVEFKDEKGNVKFRDEVDKEKINNDSDGTDNNCDMDFLVAKNDDVSLQKFITQVNSMDLTDESTTLKERGNCNYSNSSEKPIAKNIKANSFKSSNPVKILQYDKVKYTIRVYNNGDTTAQNIKISDTLNGYSNYTYKFEGNSVYYYNIENDNYNGRVKSGCVSYTNNISDGITISEIPAGKYIEIYISIEFKGYKTGKITNTAKITSSTIGTYRTIDSDDVDMQPNQIGLQKFIINVNPDDTNWWYVNNLTEQQTQLKNRVNTKYSTSSEKNPSLTSASNNYKHNNSVLTKMGDTVTYVIRVYNNGNYPVKNVTISDTVSSNTAYNGYTIVKNQVSSVYYDFDGNSKGTIGKVTSNNGVTTFAEIPALRYVEIYIQIQFNADNNFASGIVTNTAKITSGTEQTYRTQDSDDVELYNQYKEDLNNVSMQKYIVDVEGNGLNGRTSITNRKNRYAYVSSSSMGTSAGHIPTYCPSPGKKGHIGHVSTTIESHKNISKNNNVVWTGSANTKTNNKKNKKIDSVVEIGQGEEVTYKIALYNNSGSTAYDINIEDINNGNGTITNIKATVGNMSNEDSMTVGGATTLTKNGNTYLGTGNLRYLTYNNGTFNIRKLAKNKVMVIYVTMKFDQYTSNTIINTAKITNTNNKTTYRTIDKDFINMTNNVDVSMQKYIVGVDGETLTSTQTGLINRKNHTAVGYDTSLNIDNSKIKDANVQHAIYEKPTWLVVKNINVSNNNKKDDNDRKIGKVVSITCGQEVTYTIRVYNNGKYTANNVEITDEVVWDTSSGESSIADKVEIKEVKADIVESSNEESASLKDAQSLGISYNNGKFTISKLKGNKVAVINVTIKFKSDSGYSYNDDLIKNKAYISGMLQTNNSNYRNADADYVVLKPVNVSLQKYVTSYTENNGTTRNKGDERSGYYATSNNNLKINGNNGNSNISPFNHQGAAVTSSISSRYFNNNMQKIDNEVSIIKDNNVGYNDVTYKIIVYNNGEYTASNLTVTDRKSAGKGTITNIDVRCSSNKTSYTINNKGNDKREIVINKLPSGQRVEVYITVRYNESYESQRIRNLAWVKTIGKNETSYRTVDADYIRIVEYSVSLEKYVTKIEYGKGTNTGATTISDREGKRYNDTLTDGNANKNPFKLNNKVEVEPGDKITFTIKLTNTNIYDVPVKIKEIEDEFTNESTGVKLTYDSSYGIKGNGGGSKTNIAGNKYKISFTNPNLLAKGQSVYVTIRFIVEVPRTLTTNSYSLYNMARITVIQGQAGDVHNLDSNPYVDIDGTDNNRDKDFLKTKTYAVSLHKALVEVNGKATASIPETGVKYTVNSSGQEMNLGKVNRRFSYWESEADTRNDNNNEQTNRCNVSYAKENNPVTVSSGDSIKYSILLRNDGSANITIPVIMDQFSGNGYGNTKNSQLTDIFALASNGDGFAVNAVYKGKTYGCIGTSHDHDNNTCCWLGYKNLSNRNEGLKIENNIEIEPGELLTINLYGTVRLSNMSLEEIRNYANIYEGNRNNNRTTESLYNRNGNQVLDTTTKNNDDADYFKMRDITIEGTVWNDKALNKTVDNYNGVYDTSKEDALSGIKVYLYRVGVDAPIAETTTGSNGKYIFNASSIKNKGVVTHSCEQYIKAAYQCNGGPHGIGTKHALTYWSGSYYSYYVVFEYDGITYTSTTFADVTSNNSLDSNAKEDGAKVKESRATFNNRFSTINNTSGITYTTKNEENYIPQSNHVYNSATMAMQSSTNLISLSNDANLEQQLKHVNLGLRGKDIFDLELTSDVYSTKVTVNNQEGAYNYNSNRVTVRKKDISVAEDAANIASEARNSTVSEVNQYIRKTDIQNNNYDVNNDGRKGDTGLEIEVTYKITVTNASRTDGTATKITNYYDSKYDFVRAYSGTRTLRSTTGESGTGFKSVVIETPATNLSQGNSMDIYVVYKLKDAPNTLKVLLDDGEKVLPTYNMAEITEYKTQCASGQTEYTRGLLDKDSAPGSANKEQVRTTDTVGKNTKTTGGNPTTVQYYFAGSNLAKLKYEDDTYATPTLYFVTPPDKDDDGDGNSDYSRIIKGIVFEDYTSLNDNLVKSGNGIKDSSEPNIKGIKVELIEGSTVRYTTTTDEQGYYQFKDFLPGNYTIKYYYGDTEDTFLKKAPNEESYNGEDFQATNNSYDVEGMNVKKLSTRTNFWYLDNETQGTSTAKDDVNRRQEVSRNVISFTDEQMGKLNRIRDGEQLTDIGSSSEADSLIGNTYMYANTKNMLFTVEKSEISGDNVVQRSELGKYTIENMNFGIAEVPVTRIDLTKEIAEFTITDSSGTNVMASYKAGVTEGNVIKADRNFDISIEDEKLQGAKLQIKFNVKSEITIELNFDRTGIKATISELHDFINNNLTYNKELGDNDSYWQVPTTLPTSSSLDDSNTYTTLLKAKDETITKLNNGEVVPIILEKVLSSTDSTVEGIVTSNIDSYEYNNIIEITKINYENVTPTDSGEDPDGGSSTDPGGSTGGGSTTDPLKDRVRTNDRYIIIPGVQHDTAESGEIIIHPPTGFLGIDTIYYIIAVISLGVLAIGVFGIKKFVLKPKK